MDGRGSSLLYPPPPPNKPDTLLSPHHTRRPDPRPSPKHTVGLTRLPPPPTPRPPLAPPPLQEKQSKEDGIVGLLDKLTKLGAITSSALPSQKKFKEMQDELEYKKMQLENTQTTQERLKEVRGPSRAGRGPTRAWRVACCDKGGRKVTGLAMMWGVWPHKTCTHKPTCRLACCALPLAPPLPRLPAPPPWAHRLLRPPCPSLPPSPPPQELAMRRTELDKIDTLEDKIKVELKQLAEKQTSMEGEMNEFGSVSHESPVCGLACRGGRGAVDQASDA